MSSSVYFNVLEQLANFFFILFSTKSGGPGDTFQQPSESSLPSPTPGSRLRK